MDFGFDTNPGHHSRAVCASGIGYTQTRSPYEDSHEFLSHDDPPHYEAIGGDRSLCCGSTSPFHRLKTGSGSRPTELSCFLGIVSSHISYSWALYSGKDTFQNTYGFRFHYTRGSLSRLRVYDKDRHTYRSGQLFNLNNITHVVDGCN